MIGNDVVDIAAARKESDIWRKGWQEKLFTESERHYIINADNPELAVWLLWSMKEAAYKAWNRQTGIRAFIPQKLECIVEMIFETKARGKVKLEREVYQTQTIIENRMIHTIAAQNQSLLNDIREISPELISRGVDLLPCLKTGDMYFPASKSHHGSGIRAVVLASKTLKFT